MKHRIALLATLALLAGLPAAAQETNKPRTARIAVENPDGGGGRAAHAPGCGQDAFGARTCEDGTSFPNGPFGARPAKKAPAAAAPAAARPAPMPGLPRPAGGGAAEDGNLYGMPGGGAGQDGFGCRTDKETGQVTCG